MQKQSWIFIFLNLIGFMIWFFLFPIEHIKGNMKTDIKPSVLLIYAADHEAPTQEVNLLQQWLFHFSSEVRVVFSEHVQTSDFQGISHVLFISQSDRKLPASVQKRLQLFEGKKLFIDPLNNVNQTQINRIVNPKEEIDILLEKPIILPLISPSSYTRVVLEGWKGSENIGPVAYEHNDILYFLINKFDTEMIQHIVIELLHEFFEIKLDRKNDVLILLEKIDPLTNAEHLEHLLQLLQKRDVSYLLAVSPITYDNQMNSDYHLQDHDELITVLQRSIDQRGYVLLDLLNENVDIEKGIQQLSYHQIYPIGVYGNFLTSNIDQKWVHVHEDIGRISLFQNQQNLSLYARYSLPETSITEFHRLQKQMNDFSFFGNRFILLSFPAYLSEKDLEDLISIVEANNDTQWLDINTFETSIQVPYVSIHLKNSQLSGEENLPFFKSFLITRTFTTVEIILWIIACVTIVTLIFFIVYLVWLRLKLRKRLFQERNVNSNG